VVKQLIESQHINGPEAVRYWQKQHQITTTIWDSIDWDALATAYKEVLSAKCNGLQNRLQDTSDMGRIWQGGNFGCQWHAHDVAWN